MSVEPAAAEGHEVTAAGAPLPPVPLPLACPACGLVVDPQGMRSQLCVCRCGHHFRMHADAWIALLASEGSWRESWADLRAADFPSWRAPRPYRSLLSDAYAARLQEAVRTGTCCIGRHTVWLAVFDFRFMGGTLGVASGERLALGMEEAAALGLPYVLVAASGGARMQEGCLALMQMAKVNAALQCLVDAPVPFLSILTDPTFGGTAASLALLADLNLAEPGASIGFAGARVIREATHEVLPDDFQSAEFQQRHGQVDIIVPRWRLRATIAKLLDLFSGSPHPGPATSLPDPTHARR